MGLTKSSSGFSVVAGDGFFASVTGKIDKTVAFLGNPNVGKSSLFNLLTGMDQHTGNWPGKTVTGAVGRMKRSDKNIVIADLPGTYSLIADSAEEEVARNCIIFERPDLCVVVCDASVPERGLPLVLQALELTEKVAVCFNLCDRAEKNGVKIDIEKISKRLGVPVVCTSARNKKSVDVLARLIEKNDPIEGDANVIYPQALDEAVEIVCKSINDDVIINDRFVAHRLLEGDKSFENELRRRGMLQLIDSGKTDTALSDAKQMLADENGFFDVEKVRDATAEAIIKRSDEILEGTFQRKCGAYSEKDKKIDRILTGRIFGYPLMLLLLLFTLWLTIVGANYPSNALSSLFEVIGGWLESLFLAVNAPIWLKGVMVDGVYRVLAFVVSVMLPPMAIFFPLFTFLEDVGYLPRIAFNLDRPFCRCGTCGKQALTMCMGLGCNAAGVVGCRIIDSPRERLIATLTNSFIPCNGRFPTLIALIAVFFAVGDSSFLPALMLTAIIILGIIMTFLATKLLSVTFFRGSVGTFAMEMPPFRPPQPGKVIVRSIFDRTLFVLGRAVAVAAPAGAVIWILANVNVGERSLLMQCSSALEPIGRAMGLDGVILLAFILGLPANEIVLPIIIMAYTAGGGIGDIGGYAELRTILSANGWTNMTALSFIVFSLFHWPCSTTLITIKKETGSIKMAILSALLPTVFGVAICLIINMFG